MHYDQSLLLSASLHDGGSAVCNDVHGVAPEQFRCTLGMPANALQSHWLSGVHRVCGNLQNSCEPPAPFIEALL